MHTPSPWLVVPEKAPMHHNGDIAVTTPKERIIAVAFAHADAGDNAKLIALAPEMYNHIQALLKAWSEYMTDDDLTNPHDSNVPDRIEELRLLMEKL